MATEITGGEILPLLSKRTTMQLPTTQCKQAKHVTMKPLLKALGRVLVKYVSERQYSLTQGMEDTVSDHNGCFRKYKGSKNEQLYTCLKYFLRFYEVDYVSVEKGVVAHVVVLFLVVNILVVVVLVSLLL